MFRNNEKFRYKERMDYRMYVDKIFERATIRGIADYLLFGMGPDEDDRSYEERLDEPYMRFEKAVEKYDKSKTSELLDLCNEVSSETASVYMEIGLQAGILLMVDVIKNIHVEKKISFTDFVNRDEVFNGNETLLDAMYKEWVDGELGEVLQKDERYQKINKEMRKKVEKIDKLGFGKEEEMAIDRALLETKERCAEYGRVLYKQGFFDAINLLKC